MWQLESPLFSLVQSMLNAKQQQEQQQLNYRCDVSIDYCTSRVGISLPIAKTIPWFYFGYHILWDYSWHHRQLFYFEPNKVFFQICTLTNALNQMNFIWFVFCWLSRHIMAKIVVSAHSLAEQNKPKAWTNRCQRIDSATQQHPLFIA